MVKLEEKMKKWKQKVRNCKYDRAALLETFAECNAELDAKIDKHREDVEVLIEILADIPAVGEDTFFVSAFRHLI